MITRRRRALLPALCALVLAISSGMPALAGPGASDDRWALVIGISKHAGKTKGTVGGAGDAKAVHEALLRAGFAQDQIRVLVDGAATAANIRKGLEWLSAKKTSGSFSVFHYSGHVLQRGGDRDRDGEKVDEYLMPYDSKNLISDRELSNRLKEVEGWLWVDIAGCEAAGFDEGGLSSPRRLVTASSQESEKSYEQPAWGMSVFTGLLVNQAMLSPEGQRDADKDKNGSVSIQEAFNYAAPRATEITARQKRGPQRPYIAGGDNLEWFLSPPPPPAPGPSGGERRCLIVCLG